MITNRYLLEVYRSNKTVKNNHSSIYWKNINSSKKFNIKNLKNFRADQVLSKNSDDQINLSAIKLLDYFKYFKSDFLIKNLPRKNIGNNKNFLDYLGFYFDYGIIHHLKWYEKIRKFFFKKKKIKTICEIGGGFGSFARIILNNHCVKYILIDLPENNLLQAYFLKEHFPSKKIYLHTKKDNLTFRDYQKYDIFILPSFITLDPKIKIDLFINTRSFQEMEMQEIKRYFDLIQTNDHVFYFLNVNRYSKTIGEEKINFWDYPYDNYWKVLISETAFLQNQVHFLFCSRLSKKIKKKKIDKTMQNIKLLYNCKKKTSSIYLNYWYGILYFFCKNILILPLSKKFIRRISYFLFNISSK